MKILTLALALVWGATGFGAEEPVSRIAFGSCYKPQKQTEIWEEVEKFKPQLWIWLGDNFYNDWADGPFSIPIGQGRQMAATLAILTSLPLASWSLSRVFSGVSGAISIKAS